MAGSFFIEAPIRTRLLATCLLRLDRNREGEQLVVAQLPPESREDFLAFYHVVGWAQEGKLDEAVQNLLGLLEANPQDRTLREAVLALLKRQAVQKINARDWSGVEMVLERMAGIDPDYPGIRDLRTPLERVLPAMALKTNRRSEAAAAWEEGQRQNPHNGLSAHNLALLYYFEALALAGGEKPASYSRLREHWQKTMANWALTAYQDGFWAEWAAQRQMIYKVSAAAVTHLRQDWQDELSKKFRQVKNEQEVTGRDAGREMYEDLEAQYWLETVTASTLRELKKVSCPNCQKITVPVTTAGGESFCEHHQCRQPLAGQEIPHHLPCCGPFMLRHLGLAGEAQKLAEGAAQLPGGASLSSQLKGLQLPFLKNNAEALSYLLSSWNLGLAYLVQRNFLKAIDLLQKGDDPRTAALLLYAYLEDGKLMESQIPPLPRELDDEAVRYYLVPVREALDAWRQGWQYHHGDRRLGEELGERLEALSVRAGNELKHASGPFGQKKQWNHEIRLLSAGIEILELAMNITARERIKDTLVVLFMDRGESYLRNNNVSRCISDLEAALKLRPRDHSVKERAANAYNSKGCRGSSRECVNDFTRAIKLDGTKGLYYRNRGLAYAEIRQKANAVRDLEKACELEPGNSQYREELAKILRLNF